MAAALSATPTTGAGTVSITKGSNVITGVGTAFTSGQVGNTIIVIGGWNALITAFGSATQVSVSEPPDFTASAEPYSTTPSSTVVNVTGTNTSLNASGLSGVAGISTRQTGGQTIYRCGAFRMSIAAGNSLTYNAVDEALAWSSSIPANELNVGGTITITGSRTNGTLTRNVYPIGLYFGRLSATVWNPADSHIIGNGTKNFTGITVDANGPFSEVSYNITDCKFRNRTQSANFRMSTSTSINGIEVDNANVVLVGVPAALNGLSQFASSSVQWVSLTPTTPTTPRKYYNWSMNGGIPQFQSYGTATYAEQVNYGDFAGASLLMNHGNGFYVRFSRDATINYKTLAGANVSSFVAYCPDNNNGNRATPYTADEPMIFSGTNGTGTGNRLIAINRGISFNSNSTLVDIRTPANNTVGDDAFYVFAYGYTPIRLPVNLKGNNTLTSSLTATADSNVTLSASAAAAKLASSFTVDTITKVVTVTANSSFDDIYDALVAFKVSTTEANLKAPTTSDYTKYIVTASGSSLTAYTGWTLVVNSGVTLSAGSKFTYVYFDTITNNGSITGVYGSTAGVSTIWQFQNITTDTSLAVYDASGNTKYFQGEVTSAGTYSYYIPPGVSETYYYAVEQYGKKREEGNFPANSGGVLFYVPSYAEDVGISQTTKATVAAYTAIDTLDKLYDYTAYKRLSEEFIKLGQIATRNGTAVDIGSYSMKVNASASSVESIASSIITIKASNLAVGSKYSTIIATPPATVTPTTTETITANIEDGNGDSSVTIQGGSGDFTLWKITNATPEADYATGTNLGNVGNVTFRFLHADGYKIVIVDNVTGYRIPVSMSKGIYTKGLFFGDQVQLAQSAEVTQINNKVDILQTEVGNIMSNFDINTDSLHAISDAVDLVKAKTDQLGFTVPNILDTNIQYVNDVQVKGTGTDSDPWNPA